MKKQGKDSSGRAGMTLVHVGKTGRPHGIRGEIKAWPLEGSSGAWLEATFVYIGSSGEVASRYRLLGSKKAGAALALELEGIESRDEAARLSNLNIYVERRQLPECGDGTYYLEDLRNLAVVDTRGRKIGRLVDAFHNGAHEVYAIETMVGEILLPVVEGVVELIDVEKGVMVVNPPEGLPGIDALEAKGEGKDSQ